MTKCYILGAGASHGYSEKKPTYERPPLTDDFFKNGYRLGLFAKTQFPNLFEKLIEYILKLGKKPPEDLLNLDIDVEDFLSWCNDKFLEISSKIFGGSTADFQNARAHSEELMKFQRALGEAYYFVFLLLKHYSTSYCPCNDAYQRLALHYFDQKYLVVSLNYDVIFEHAISCSNLDYDYHLMPARPSLSHLPHVISIAKIHGSINLLNPIRGLMNIRGFRGNAFEKIIHFIHSNKFNVQQCVFIKDLEYLRRIGLPELAPSTMEFYEPAIIPPFANYKDYEKVTAYQHTWDLARDYLKQSDEVVFIGCSIREKDQKLNEVLAENIGDGARITIVSPSHDEIWKKLQKLKGKTELKTCYDNFYEYSLTL